MELQIVPPGTELPPEGICYFEIVKNEFLNRPSLTNPTDNDDEANKKYVDEKTETIDLSSFSLKHAGRNRFIETFIREKATCWFHADHNSTFSISITFLLSLILSS